MLVIRLPYLQGTTMHTWRMTLYLALVCALLPQISDVYASTSRHMDLAFLTDKADLIFSGTVSQIEVGQTTRESGGKQTFTYVSFFVDATYKGAVRKRQVTLRFEGGKYTDPNGVTYHSDVPGTPTFLRGERYLVFARNNGKTPVPVLGLDQGLYLVTPHPTTGNLVLVDSRGRPIVGHAGGQWRRSKERLAARAGHIDRDFTHSLRAGPTADNKENAPHKEQAPSVEVVLESLHDYVAERSTEPSFDAGQTVELSVPPGVVSNRGNR